MDEANEQRQQRIKKLDQLRAAGVPPYGTRFDAKDRVSDLIKLHGQKTKETLEGEKIACTIAGRVVALRRFGKAAFAVLQDGADRLQIYLEEGFTVGEGLTVTEQLDLGDWIGVTGTLFRTKTNEFTVEVHDLTVSQQGASSSSGEMARLDGCRNPVSSALCRSDRKPGGARHFRGQEPHYLGHQSVLD